MGENPLGHREGVGEVGHLFLLENRIAGFVRIDQANLDRGLAVPVGDGDVDGDYRVSPG
jgi:hypothetical protein